MNSTPPIVINPANTVHLMVDVQRLFCEQVGRNSLNTKLYNNFVAQQLAFQQYMLFSNIVSINIQFGDMLDVQEYGANPTHLWDGENLTIKPYPSSGQICETTLKGQVPFVPDVCFDSMSDLWLLKNRCSAFSGCEPYENALTDFINRNNYKHSIITGLYAEACVFYTWQDSVKENIHTILPYDKIYYQDPYNADSMKTMRRYLEESKARLPQPMQALTTICHSKDLPELFKQPVFA